MSKTGQDGEVPSPQESRAAGDIAPFYGSIGYEAQQAELAAAEEAFLASLPADKRLRLARQAVVDAFGGDGCKVPNQAPKAGEQNGLIL